MMSRDTLFGRIRYFTAFAVLTGTAMFAVATPSAAPKDGCCSSTTTHCNVIDAYYVYCTSDDNSNCAPLYSYCCTAVGDLCASFLP